ncbi:MAG: aminoacyl-tRNA hydrolase [Thermoleophilia bacterium]|nr:aminoacyl-tRNA hydrolase [Thermoleophilia bacterium]
MLVAGLGNPGPGYRLTRHNAGFLVADELARRHSASFRSRFSGRVADLRVDGRRVVLLEPETYMNESGRSVAAAVRFYKLPLSALLVVHDDVDLDIGRLQVRLGGGLAGHNGLRSLVGHLGSGEFMRLRIGVGRPERGDRRPVADFVLSPFPPEVDLDGIVARAADAVESIAREGVDAARQRFNERV